MRLPRSHDNMPGVELRNQSTHGVRALVVAMIATLSLSASLPASERQLTSASRGHVLTNTNVWSADGEWIVFDTRVRDDQFTGTTIERVNVTTRAVQVLYTSRNGATCGVVTAHPRDPRVIFILGPEHPTPNWSYGISRRQGVMVNVGESGSYHPLDAAVYAPPFVSGALRGGSHVHVFSPDGMRVSFTYDDEVLARLGAESADGHEINQRNVGVAAPVGPVAVGTSHPRNHGGEWFSVLATRTVNRPRPGSDEISRACEEGWVGTEGYVSADGTRQRYALAFQGTVVSARGTTHAEVFLVDLPEDITQPGAQGPLEGTALKRPAPPLGARQRRLTHTDDRQFPGVVAVPRHWLKCAPDGSRIAFLMKDERGVAQLWTVSPNGGAPRQITHNAHDIASAFTWSPDGRWIAHVMDRSVCITGMDTGETRRLTQPRADAANAPRPFACVFSPDGNRIAYTRNVLGVGASFDQVFVVSLTE